MSSLLIKEYQIEESYSSGESHNISAIVGVLSPKNFCAYWGKLCICCFQRYIGSMYLTVIRPPIL
jgi:hypothetical protein